MNGRNKRALMIYPEAQINNGFDGIFRYYSKRLFKELVYIILPNVFPDFQLYLAYIPFIII